MRLFSLAAVLALTACATLPPAAMTAVQRGLAAWATIRTDALAILPLLSPEQAGRVRTAVAIGDAAAVAAGAATSQTEATAALATVNTAADQVTAASK